MELLSYSGRIVAFVDGPSVPLPPNVNDKLDLASVLPMVVIGVGASLGLMALLMFFRRSASISRRSPLLKSTQRLYGKPCLIWLPRPVFGLGRALPSLRNSSSISLPLKSSSPLRLSVAEGVPCTAYVSRIMFSRYAVLRTLYAVHFSVLRFSFSISRVNILSL